MLLLDLSSGFQSSLVAKLDSVIKKLLDANENNDVAACNSLSAFINEVEAQAGHMINVDDASFLTDRAFDIREALECSL